MLKPNLYLMMLLTLFCASGAQCISGYTPPWVPPAPTAPDVLPPSPTLQQVIDAVHANSLLVHSFSANNVSIGMPGAPSLRGQMAVERDRRIRLTAGILGGTEIDFGSNDEMFWVWVRRMQPPSLLICRHDQFHHSIAQQQMPIEPQWLLDAMGLVTFDPRGAHEGPKRRRDGALEIWSTVPVPAGSRNPTKWLNKITVVDPRHAWVLEQHLYDPEKTGGVNQSPYPVASAISSGYRYDPATGVSLPRHIELRVPDSQFSLTLDLSGVTINRIVGDPVFLWQPPSLPGVPVVDLGRIAPQPVSTPLLNGR